MHPNIIIMFQHSKNIEYPRQKNIIHNLNDLLFDKKPIKLPQKQIQEKFTPIFFRSNSATLRSPKKQHKNNVATKKMPLSSNMNVPISSIQSYNHMKSVSAVMGKAEQTKNQQQIRKQKMKALLSVGNMRKTLSNNRKMLTSQTYKYKTTMTGDNRAKTAQKPTYRQKEEMINFQSTQLPINQKLDDNRMRYSSVQVGFTRQTNNFYDYRPKIERETRSFLKKGSSINKSVLNTILKLKLSKNVYEEEQDIEKNIKNQEIISMIKVYKGTTSANNTIEKQKILENVHPPEKKKDHPLIIGWEDQTEEYNID